MACAPGYSQCSHAYAGPGLTGTCALRSTGAMQRNLGNLQRLLRIQNTGGTHYAYNYDERRDADLLQRLGQGTAGGFQSWLAAQRGRLRRPDAISGRPWLPMRGA